MLQRCTLVIPLAMSGHVLLGRKARGFGVGKVCGFGGKVLDGESVEAAALRELQEEVDLEPTDLGALEYCGQLRFDFDDTPGFTLHIAVFLCRVGVGRDCVISSRSDEFLSPLRWHHQSDLPFQAMWPDAAQYMPLVLSGCKGCTFSLHFTYKTKDGDGLSGH